MIQLGSQVVGVLLRHQVRELFLELVDDEDSLWTVAELDEGLKDAAAVVLVAQLGVLLTDVIDALLHDRVLFLTRHFLLLHQQLVVRDLNTIKEVQVRQC